MMTKLIEDSLLETAAKLSYAMFVASDSIDRNVYFIIVCEHNNIQNCNISLQCFVTHVNTQANEAKVNIIEILVNNRNVTVDNKTICNNHSYTRKIMTVKVIDKVFKEESENITWHDENMQDLDEYIKKKTESAKKDRINIEIKNNKIISFLDTTLYNVEAGTNYSSQSMSVVSIITKNTAIQQKFCKSASSTFISMKWNSKIATKLIFAVAKFENNLNSNDMPISDVIVIHSKEVSNCKNSVINITFTFNFNGPLDKIRCSHQNKILLTWETDYCKLTNIKSKDDYVEVTCSCNHLTSFSAIFNPYKTSDVDGNMKHVSTILAGISLLSSFLVTCVLSYLHHQNGKNISYVLKLCLIISLAILYTSLILSNVINWVDNNCTIIGAVLHGTAMIYYLQVLQFSIFTTILIHNPFTKLKIIHIIPSVTLSYIIPIITSVVTAIYYPDYYKKCVVQGLPRHVSLTLLGIAVLLYNFVSASYVSFMSFRTIDKTNSHLKIKRKLKCVISISIIYGLPFIIQFLIFKPLQPYIEWIFIIFNSLQGFWITLFIVINKIMKKASTENAANNTDETYNVLELDKNYSTRTTKRQLTCS